MINFLKWLIQFIYNTIGPTLRVVNDPFQKIDQFKAGGRNLLFAVWHEETAICFWIYRNRNAGILVEDSKKGEVLATMAQRLGYSTFGVVDDPKDSKSVRATIQLIKHLREGHDGTVALDGPNGPYHLAKPGILAIAEKSESLVVPIRVWYQWKFTCWWRWDKYQIPLPFSKVIVQIGDPVSNEKELIEAMQKDPLSAH